MSVNPISEQPGPDCNKLTWYEAVIQSKTSTWSAVNFKKHMTLMSYKAEPVIWSCDTGQQIPCFHRLQLTITWMSDIKDICCKSRLGYISWSVAFMLHNIVITGCTHLQFMPHYMHACDSVPVVMLLCLVAKRATRALLSLNVTLFFSFVQMVALVSSLIVLERIH